MLLLLPLLLLLLLREPLTRALCGPTATVKSKLDCVGRKVHFASSVSMMEIVFAVPAVSDLIAFWGACCLTSPRDLKHHALVPMHCEAIINMLWIGLRAAFLDASLCFSGFCDLVCS